MQVNRINRTFLSLLLLGAMSFVFKGCASGCVTCSGITADLLVCKGDFSETADYNAYLAEYRELGGICEE